MRASDPMPCMAAPIPLRKRLALALAGVLALASCGGGGPAETPLRETAQAVVASSPPTPEPRIAIFPGRGEFRGMQHLRDIPLPELAAAANDFNNRVAGITPRYAVSTWRIDYLTVDGHGRQVVASGLAALPIKPAGARSPVLSYQHGTIFKNAEAPTQAISAAEPPIALASLGYLVLAADYVGYGASRGVQHPYLLSAPSAAVVIDFLTAARLLRQALGTPSNGQLFMVGYSEGAYVTMAAHREMQASASFHLPQVVASVGGGGPYDVGQTLDQLLDRVRDQSPILGALIKPGFLGSLGSTIRNEVRRALIAQIIPSDADVSFQTTFLDNFLADDVGAIERMSNVHDWKPEQPFRLFHGREDQTVPYNVSVITLGAMRARGTPPALISLTDCSTPPFDHLKCVPEFFRRSVDYLGVLARDL